MEGCVRVFRNYYLTYHFVENMLIGKLLQKSKIEVILVRFQIFPFIAQVENISLDCEG